MSNWFKNRRQRDRAAETTRDKEHDKRYEYYWLLVVRTYLCRSNNMFINVRVVKMQRGE